MNLNGFMGFGPACDILVALHDNPDGVDLDYFIFDDRDMVLDILKCFVSWNICKFDGLWTLTEKGSEIAALIERACTMASELSCLNTPP